MAERKAAGSANLENALTDSLLEWMSFRGLGRIANLPPDLVGEESGRRIVETMAVLGHVESADRDVWRVAPPVLAGLPANAQSWDAVLCGARTSGLLSRLGAACDRHGVGLRRSRVADAPEVIRISSFSCSALEAAAGEAEVIFQRDSAFTLLACTPSVEEWPRTPCPMVSGRVGTVRRFSRSNIRWVSSSLEEAVESQGGLFRIQRDWDWVSIIKMSADQSAYIDDRAGRLIVARKLKAAAWDAELGTFSVPGQLYPPRIIARALSMCSGTPPYFDKETRRVCFSNIPLGVVRLALEITGLRLA